MVCRILPEAFAPQPALAFYRAIKERKQEDGCLSGLHYITALDTLTHLSRLLQRDTLCYSRETNGFSDFATPRNISLQGVSLFTRKWRMSHSRG